MGQLLNYDGISIFAQTLPDPIVISVSGALDEPNEYKVEQTDSGQSVKDRFYAVGEMQQDFRKDGAQVKE